MVAKSSKSQHFYDYSLHFWRTQSGAEVDFVLYKNENLIIPIEVKYRSMNDPIISRSFRSFIEAYQPKYGFYITKDLNKIVTVDGCKIIFLSISWILIFFDKLKEILDQD